MAAKAYILPLAAITCLPGCGGSTPTESVTASAEDVWRAFNADEAAAERRFQGKAIDLDAMLDTILQPGSRKPTLFLGTPGESSPAFLKQGPASPQLRAAIGSRIGLHCERVDHVGSQPYFYDCDQEPIG